jgi:uncharacterized membrane protein
MGRLWMFIIVSLRDRYMQFPLSLWDISLVLAVVAIVLFVTSELASSYRERNFAIEKKVLRRTALMFGFAFLFTVVVRVYQILSVT